MENKLLKFYMLTFLLIGDFVMFAQEGTPDNTSGDGETVDEEDPVPVNGRLIYLAIVGIAFAMYYYSQKKKEKQLN